MIEPTRIVVAHMDLKLEADQVTGITVLAAAAMACMAAIGNGDAAKVEQILRLAVPTYKRLSIDARDTVQTVADELVDCALAGKMFMAHGKVRVQMPDAEAAYHDPTKSPRFCDHCGRTYTGPAVYCSLACALADA